VSGTVDIAAVPEHCLMSLTVDTHRLTSRAPKLVRAFGERGVRIDAVRTGQFAAGGWDVAGSVASGDESCAFDTWVDYRGVYCRRRDLAYAWLTMNLTVPLMALGMSAGPITRGRDVAISVDVLAIADPSATSTAS
jgi:hypothetical protein